MPLAIGLAIAVGSTGCAKLLDIGGGHGWYSAELCRRYPRLTATVLGSASWPVLVCVP